MTEALRETPSLWQALSPDAKTRPSLSSAESAEIAVVGAGISGLSLALQLAADGKAPVILEAETPGAGALGASAGIVAPQLVRDTPSSMIGKLGSGLGHGWLRLIAESGGYLFNLIAEHQIDCDAVNHGFIAPSAHADAFARLTALKNDWQPYRTDMDVLDMGTVADLTGCRGYRAAILDRSGGALDPLKLAHGLADKAEALGARIYNHSAVTGIERTSGAWRLTTAGGHVTARHVVLCANGGNAVVHPGLEQTILPMGIYEMATHPVSEAMRADVLPQGHVMTDMELDIFSLRYARSRLVTAYPARKSQSLKDIEREVNGRLERILITPHRIRISHLWQGTAWINSSLLPRIVEIDDNMIAVQACNGRGIATNAIVGREVARTIMGCGRYQSELASQLPAKISSFWLAGHLPNMVMSMGYAFRRLRDVWKRDA